MSNPPPASAPLTASSSKKKVRNTVTNVSKKLLMESKALNEFAAYDSPSLAGGGNSFTEAAMEKLMTTLCFGDSDGSDRESMSYADQVLVGVNRFQGLFTASPATQDTSERESALILTIPVLLHQQSGIHIYVGSRSIEKELLCSKSLANPTPISGRTMLRLAKDVIVCSCKKMQALVTRSDSPYKDINYTPSGTNYEDYVKWCLAAMYKNEQSSDGEKEETKRIWCNEQDNLDAASPPNKALSPPIGNDITIADDCEVPSNYFYKGFLAWCLWGWIPIPPGSMMKSFLSSDIKCNTSFGRKIASRQAMRSSNLCNSNERIPQKGVVFSQKQQGVEEQVETNLAIRSQERTTDVLERTYKLFEAELIEKELQNTQHLELRIICDNLISLNSRRHDRLLERFYRTPNGPMQDKIKGNLDRYNREIDELEMNLKKLHEAEVSRRNKHVLISRQAAAAASSFGTSSVQIEPPREIQCSEMLRTTSLATLRASSPATTMSGVPLLALDLPPVCDVSFICMIDCKKNPSTHKCRKCHQFVCDISRSEKRGLEMIWWCETCFENESLSNQK